MAIEIFSALLLREMSRVDFEQSLDNYIYLSNIYPKLSIEC
jgi:hypothetical protein